MQNKSALVTGAASGVGRAVAERFARAGAHVVAFDVDRGGLETLAAELDQVAGSCAIAIGDVREPEDIEAALDGVDVNVVAAIAGLTRVGSVLDMDLQDRDLVLGVNLLGVWNTVRAALPGLLRNGPGGRILACGSVESILAGEGLAAYVASKHAVVGLVKSIALELATTGITANVISPAAVDTALLRTVAPPEAVDHIAATTPIPRLSTPAEVAALFEFLAGPEVGYLTGENIVVDGGLKLVNAHTAGQGWARSQG